jgi:hypothetical protein
MSAGVCVVFHYFCFVFSYAYAHETKINSPNTSAVAAICVSGFNSIDIASYFCVVLVWY